MPTVRRQVAKPKRRRKAGSAVDRIAPVAEGDRGIKINIYGRSGTGKTTLAGDFPKPCLHIVCSGIGLGESRSIANIRGIKDVELETCAEIVELRDYVLESDYRSVILDHATGLQDLKLKETLGLSEIPLALYQAASKGQSWSVVSRQQYGQIALEMKELLRELLKLPQHVVILAQEREFNTESEGDLLMPFVGSALTPSVAGWLGPACDYICQMFIRQRTKEKEIKVAKKVVKTKQRTQGVDYCLRTGPDPVYITKFRVPKGTQLPDLIVDPSFAKINKLIWGES